MDNWAISREDTVRRKQWQLQRPAGTAEKARPKPWWPIRSPRPHYLVDKQKKQIEWKGHESNTEANFDQFFYMYVRYETNNTYATLVRYQRNYNLPEKKVRRIPISVEICKSVRLSGPTDKASKEPFGKNLCNQEYWAGVRADASSHFILRCTYGEWITKVVFM
ncbi:hypothetical protein FH972_012396 [Carpinus fangiana]|uniref:Uncharacterized protein n=1 Tax=Carpinus fangiana TaxID=176857 RepID=A0A5N6R3Y9_9ROSI|nr:hypothetical protein FH972_012396 [Carpinus fangiana]